ncbi:MAG: hypothetical protein RIS92_1941, partial [Verrucomicrobiota bacterium]
GALVGEEDVGFTVAVHVSDCDAVADVDGGIDVLRFEPSFWRGEEGEGREGCEQGEVGEGVPHAVILAEDVP